jgi:predicted metal-dependent hydrolase
MNTNLYQITIGQLVIDVVKKDIKNIHLGVYPPDGNIRIATPLKVNDDRVRLFAISKLPWIKKQQAKFQAQSRQSPREFISGESHYFQGRRYLLNVIYHQSSPKVIIKNNTNIHLFVRENSTLEQRKKVMTEWYRQQLKEQIPTLLDKWQSITGLTANDWGIKQMKTKWGSCNITDKRIWLNLELAKKPQHCLEYVIVHELVHLLERNHNERFIAYMDKFMPQWTMYKEELSQFIL